MLKIADVADRVILPSWVYTTYRWQKQRWHPIKHDKAWALMIVMDEELGEEIGDDTNPIAVWLWSRKQEAQLSQWDALAEA